MISFEHVSKRFGRVKALDNVSFQIGTGEVVGFLGPNGAGKTTTMRLMTGIFPPTSGRILIDGADLFKSKHLRRKIGYLAENNPLYREMTAREFLSFVAALKGLAFQNRKQAIEKVVHQCGITPVMDRIIGKLSKGFHQRIGLAQALLGDPELLILDEPTSGLDPQQIAEMRSLIRSLGGERTILISTHILPEVRMTCRRILILNQGRLVASGSPEILEQNLREAEEFLIRIRGSWHTGDQFLHELPDVLEVRLEWDRDGERAYRFLLRHDSPARSQLARLIMEAGFEILEFKAADWSLEDIFLKVTQS